MTAPWPRPVASMVRATRLEPVPADPATAQDRLARAEEKLAAAMRIVEIDIDIAYVSAYDAMRIAVTAHMVARGLRAAGNKPGAHEAVGAYAASMIASPSAVEFQRIRRRRNKAEYDDIVLGRADLDADLAHVRAVIAAVRADLGAPPAATE